MKLEEIVPPPELCKLIPAGEFEDSFAAYMETAWETEIVELGKWITIDCTTISPVMLRKEAVALAENIHADCKVIPAPTVAEIMEKMPYSKLKRTQNTFFFERKHVAGAWSGGYNAAEAALQVYFKLKGIEY